MNWHHFRTFLWLRWRIRVNQMRRGGPANAILLVILAILVSGLGLGLFVGSLLAGLFAMPEASPTIELYVWDGVLLAFLFFWAIGLLTDLQRSDPLTLDKVLHLPVSLGEAFLINYLSSLVNLILILALAVMLGLSLGSVISCGPALLVLFPLLAAFVLAVTALTYQFQGWLASLMSNPRRRRTIIVVATASFILLAQMPNLINLATMRTRQPNAIHEHYAEEQRSLQEALVSNKITREEYQRRFQQLQTDHQARLKEADKQTLRRWEKIARLMNVILPPGWIALGAASALEGNFLPAVLGTLGLTIIGTLSLWRAYRTTIRIYTGHFTSGTRPNQALPAPTVEPTPVNGKLIRLLERRLPWLSEQASAIALGSFISLLRAPEAKMMLLTPVLFALLFGSLVLSGAGNPPEMLRPVIAFGAVSMVLLTMTQLAGNQFGFDRGGFRVFVLCPAPRREILLGKNLAMSPLPLAWGLIYLVVVQFVYPMRFDHFLAVLPQLVSMYLLFSLLANWLSILAPIPIAHGSFKPANIRLVPALCHLFVVLIVPMLLGPLLLPLGIEYAAAELGGVRGIPICLILSTLMAALVVPLYLLVLTWQGQVLQIREQEILKVVASKD